MEAFSGRISVLSALHVIEKSVECVEAVGGRISVSSALHTIE